MSHVLQIIGDTLLSSGCRSLATLSHAVRQGLSRVRSRLMHPGPSSLRVSRRWLDEHEAEAAHRASD
jgi:hypothetical protein